MTNNPVFTGTKY